MANVKFNRFGKAIAENNMTSATIKAMFMAPSYVPNADTHVFVSDISASRASGTTDITLASLTRTVDNTDDRTEFGCATITTGTITVVGGTNAVVFYISTGVDSTSELLTYNELLLSSTPTTFYPLGGVLTATINANGIFSI